MKNNKGITLISLVITIIVLLILAGVSIAMLSGDNSILSRASNAAEESALANTKELITNAVNEALVEYNNDLYVNNNGEATLASYLISKVGTSASTGAIAQANAISGISVSVTTAVGADADGAYAVSYKGTSKYTFTVNHTSGALEWTEVNS